MPQLSNTHLFLAVNNHGAEMASVMRRDDQTEYVWQADPAHWGRHAPVLFPIVGRLKDNEYQYGETTYSMGQHGIARDQVFALSDSGPDFLNFTLEASSATKARYPFDFVLHIRYTLRGNEVEVAYTVENRGSVMMPFSIGAHPAFNCPLVEGESFENHYLQFEQPETCERHLLEGGLFNGETAPLLEESDRIDLTEELFADDALVIHQPKSKWLALRSKSSDRAVRISLTGFPYLGIWTKPGAPFVCLEPWQGLADYTDATGLLSEKKGIHLLMPGKSHRAAYTISFE